MLFVLFALGLGTFGNNFSVFPGSAEGLAVYLVSEV
jgi:hypothetical protein